MYRSYFIIDTECVINIYVGNVYCVGAIRKAMLSDQSHLIRPLSSITFH